jgi:glycosyltransferase involved in cell wall biosynthesis
MDEKVVCNKYWEKATPLISITTPVYNSRSTIKRTFDSVEKQTFRNFEYIIVNDGSIENYDEYVYTCNVHKKRKWGVHTARNRAIKEVRGKFNLGLDSDDELTSDALEKMLAAWEQIPKEERPQYREIVAQCIDQNGNRVGLPFPENINELQFKKAVEICDKTGGEHIGFDVAQIRKDNLWPEPEGITFVTEDIVWKKLEKEYKSYFINDMVRIYHTDTEVSLTRPGKRTIQNYKNMQWNCCYKLNNWSIYKDVRTTYLKMMLKYNMLSNILRFNGIYEYARLEKIKDKIISKIIYIPAYLGAKLYVNKLS